MPEYRFQEFYDEYAGSRYPFLDTCPMVADTLQMLDADLFLDASLYPVGNVGPLHISAVTVQSRLVVLQISNRSRTVVASTAFDPFEVGDVLAVTDTLGRPAGVLVSDATRLARFSSWVEGEHNFSQTSAVFVPSCVIPSPATGVRGVRTQQGDTLTDTVLLVGGAGVILRYVDDTIRIDVVGDPLHRRRLCEQAGVFRTPTFVQTINGCPPDQYGNIMITVGDHLVDKGVLRLSQYSDGLVIEANGR